MNEENESILVTQDLNAGAAAPIAVTQEEALEIARAQNASQPKADIPIEKKPTINEIKEQVSAEINNTPVNNTEVNSEQVNQMNDIVKVETVKKENPKVIIALIIIIAIIIICFFVFELPMVIDMLK